MYMIFKVIPVLDMRLNFFHLSVDIFIKKGTTRQENITVANTHTQVIPPPCGSSPPAPPAPCCAPQDTRIAKDEDAEPRKY